MEKITNTQYLKVGAETNVGIVKAIQSGWWFTTTDGFSHNVKDEDVFKIELIKCEDCALMFDPSDLANVFAHEHLNQTILESGKYLGTKIS